MKILFLLWALLFTPDAAVARTNDAEPDLQTVYALPYQVGTTATARRLSAVETRRGHHLNLLNFTSWEFAFNNGSVAAVAAREGIVTEVSDNMVAVVHADGTIARYRLIENIAVEQGAEVEAGKIIGYASQAAYNTWVIGFELYYPTANTATDPESSITAHYKTLENYINPLFRTSRGKMQLREGEQYRAVRRNWFAFWKR